MEHHQPDNIDNVKTADIKEKTDFHSHVEVKESSNHTDKFSISNIEDHNYYDNLSNTNLVQFEGSTSDLRKEPDCSHEDIKEENNRSELGNTYINIGKNYCNNSENVSEINMKQCESATNVKEKSVFCTSEKVENIDIHIELENQSINVSEKDNRNSQKLSEMNFLQCKATTDKPNESIFADLEELDSDLKTDLNNIAVEHVIDFVHNTECEVSKHDKDSEYNEADQLEIEAEDEGEISDGIFTDKIISDSEDDGEINETVELKKSKRRLRKQCSQLIKDQEMQDPLNDDIEEGEVKDDTIPNCRFFARGHCMFGNTCKNMHTTDKGLYKMFEADKRDGYGRLIRAHNARVDFVSLPLDVYVRNCLPPVEPERVEFRDLAWERGLRLAKQQQRQALEKRNDPDFEEKYLYMNLKESPSRKRKRTFERHPSKRDYTIARRTSDDRRKKLRCSTNAIHEERQHNMKSRKIHKRGNSYENDIAKKRKISGETEWRDPWRRSKSPSCKIRSRSNSSSFSDSCSSSYCSSQCSCHSKKHIRGKDSSKKRASTKSNALNDSKSKHLQSSKRGRSRSRSSSSRSLSSSPTEVLKFREQVYRNKPATSFESNSKKNPRFPNKSNERATWSSNINNYKPPVKKEIHKTHKSQKSQSPNTRCRRSASQSSSCHSYGTRTLSKSSCSSASYCSRSNSCASNYSYTRQTSVDRRKTRYSFTLKDELSKRAILREELNKRASLRKSKSMTKSPTPQRKTQSPELKGKQNGPKLSFKFLPKTTGKSLNSDIPKWLSSVDTKDSVEKLDKMSNVISSKLQNGVKKSVGLNAKKTPGKPVTGKSVNMLLRYQDLTRRNKEGGESLQSLNQTAKDGKQISKKESVTPTTIKKVDDPKVPSSASKMSPKTPPVDKSALMLLQYRALTEKNTAEVENGEEAQSLPSPTDALKVKKKFNKSQTISRNNSKEKIVFKEPGKISEVLRKKEIRPLGSKNPNVAAMDIESELSKPHIIQNKAMQHSKSHITMNLITDISQDHNIRSVSRKSPSTVSIAPSKNMKELSGSRRDILLKRLKAVEAAIARKKYK